MLEYFTDRAERGEPKQKYQKGFLSQRARIIEHLIGGRQSVLEWGCASGRLLAKLSARERMGRDFCEPMIQRARDMHEGVDFEVCDIMSSVEPGGKTYEAIVMDYLAPYVPDIQAALENALNDARSDTRLILTSLNAIYAPLLGLLNKIGLCEPISEMNWLSRPDLRNLLELSGWEVISVRSEQLFPFEVPLISNLCNRWLARLPIIRHLCVSIVFVARPAHSSDLNPNPSCSVIVPARNEAGNISVALERIPQMGTWTEVIFVEGNSKDNTWATIESEVARYEGPLKLSYLKQPGIGKWDAVRAGFAQAKGDLLVIQDADLTAPPEDLPKFYQAIVSGSAEFANGSRLVYPMEKGAMRFLNLLGNKFFAEALSLVLGQRIKDSLCGTKMVSRHDFERLIDLVEKKMGDFDPFGDFNLLFGAALYHLRIRDIPVRYADRTYGDTNISRFRHGAILFKMTWKGLGSLFFYPLCKRKKRGTK
ncbi:MAG: glycosyltransferase [Opitutales bacterium]